MQRTNEAGRDIERERDCSQSSLAVGYLPASGTVRATRFVDLSPNPDRETIWNMEVMAQQLRVLGAVPDWPQQRWS